MALPTWAVGQVLTAADVNNWFVPLVAYRTSTQSVTSNATLQNDNQLFVSVAANAVYDVRGMLLFDGPTGASGDLRAHWTFPAGATFPWEITCVGISGTAPALYPFTASSTPTLSCNGVGNPVAATFTGTLTTSSTSGTMQLQWAQYISAGTATTMEIGSKLILQRVG